MPSPQLVPSANPVAGLSTVRSSSTVPMVIASNRGPLSFAFDDNGMPAPVGPAGGLAGSLHDLVAGSGATWVSCAMSDADRAAVTAGLMHQDGLRIVALQPDPDDYAMAYDVVSNATLWFTHHHLYDLTRRPRFDRHWYRAWEAYRSFNQEMAAQIAAEAGHGAVVLVQDYHLALVPAEVRSLRPDLAVVHFSHTPFADPGVLRVLPDHAALELLAGMAGATACGFHTRRWANAFAACCTDWGVAAPRTFASPLTPDPDRLVARAASPSCATAADHLLAQVGDRTMILRVDRVEPSKNLVRGFWAFDDLLDRHPEHRGRVVLVALAYASRQGLAEYLAYRSEVEQAASLVNERWGTATWTPVMLDIADNPDRSFAALANADILMVNPVRDGLNLVAKEGPIVNRRDGVLVLSREAGAHDELTGPVLSVNPFDITATADALHQALTMPPAERSARAEALRKAITSRSPRRWLDDQLAAAAG